MLGGELLQLGHEFARLAGGQVGVDPQPDGLQALLLQRAPPLGDAPLGLDVAQGLAAEHGQRLAQRGPGGLGLGARPRQQCLEPPQIELVLAADERIPGRLEHEQPAQQRAHLGEVHVQRRDGAGGRTLSPQLVDKPVARERRAAAEGQQRQQRPLTPAGQRNEPSVTLEHERPQHPETTQPTGHRATQ